MKAFWNVLAVVSLCLALCCETAWFAVLLLAVFVISMQLSGNVDWIDEIKKDK